MSTTQHVIALVGSPRRAPQCGSALFSDLVTRLPPRAFIRPSVRPSIHPRPFFGAASRS